MGDRLRGLAQKINQKVPSLRGLGNNFWQPLLIAALIAVPVILMLSSAESLSAEINNVEARSDASQEMIDELTTENRQLNEMLEEQQISENNKVKRINQLKKENAELQAQVDAYIAEEQAEKKKEEDKQQQYDEKCEKYPWYFGCKDD